jgi:ATP-dependent RNA helicase RhlE
MELDDRLQRAITAADFTELTPIQEQALPLALEGSDLIGTAQTGTGKTAAFVLPILQHLLQRPGRRHRTRALIVTPTRELAEQIHAAIKQLGKHTPIKSATVYGGVGFEPQERALRRGAEIIVACPGRLLDHLRRGNADLSQVEILILDEADRMLDMGFLPSVRQIVEETPKERQTMLFSATFATELERLAGQIMRSPQRVEMGLAAPATTIQHSLCPVGCDQKTDLLVKLLQQTQARGVLIFTRTKHRADRVARQIEREGYRTAVLHSNRSQSQRQKALESFRAGQVQFLVATDIAARGLDIETISHVINYDIPDSADAYIHRIGRTGRAERTGEALTLVTSDDTDTVRDIEKALGGAITILRVEGFDFGRPTLVRPGGNRGGNRPAATPTSWSSRGGGWSHTGRRATAGRRS